MRKDSRLILFHFVAVALLFSSMFLSQVLAAELKPGDIIVADQSAFGGSGGIIKVDPITGDQEVISWGGFFVNPRGVAIDGTGKIIVADPAITTGDPADGRIIRVDPSTGTQEVISMGGFLHDPLAVVINAAGNIIVADAGPSDDSGSVIKVDPVNGDQTVVSSGGFFVDPHGVTIASGNIIVSEHHIDGGVTGAIIKVDPVTGNQTIISSGGFLIRLVHVTTDPLSNIIVASLGLDSSSAGIIEVNPETGDQTVISSGGFLVSPSGVAIDAAGSIIVADQDAFGGSGGIIKVNPANGNQTVVSSGGLFVDPMGVAIVTYLFSGFFQPVDNTPAINVAKAGSAIPVKFSLHGYQGLDIFETGYPKSQAIACDTTSPLDSIEETVTAGSSSLSYDASTDQYIYVWKTNKSWAAGSCRQLIVKLIDGSSHLAYFKFK